MQHILTHTAHPILNQVYALQQLKLKLDQCLPESYRPHYQLSHTTASTVTILIDDAIWLYPLRQFEATFHPIIERHFKTTCILTWKVRPKMKLTSG